MKNAILFVDFDHTLFDTESFKKELDFLISLVWPANLRRFVYSDSLAFLRHAEKYFDLVIFTEGVRKFQKKKVDESGLPEKINFKEIMIIPPETKPQKIGNLKQLYKGPLFLIDDKPENVDAAVVAGISVIRVKRGKYQQQKTKETPDFEVKNLKEIVDQKILEKWTT